jgi:lysophospholipase
MTFDRRAIPASAQFSMTPARDGWPLRTYVQREQRERRGSILWLGGRGDIVEKYIEAIDGWSRDGWHVTSFDWRGQGGSGRIGGNPIVGHINDFGIWIDDLADFVADWKTREAGQHVIMGHSMGGHLVLRALAEKRISPDKAVLVAPMLGFDTRGLPFSVAVAVARVMAWLSSELKPAWNNNERPAPPNASRQAFLTHDVGRYEDELWWKAQSPGLALGPPSWTWLSAAYRSMAELNKTGAIEPITTPLLILCADADQLVNAKATHMYAARLPHAKLVAFGDDVAHEILRERDPARDKALAEISDFMSA